MKNHYYYLGTDGDGGFIEGVTQEPFYTSVHAAKHIQKIVHSTRIIRFLWSDEIQFDGGQWKLRSK